MTRKPDRASGSNRPAALLTATALASTLAALVLGAAGPAVARAVKIGAGEHGDHSRVVFNMPTPKTWSATQIEGGLEIRLPGAGYDFDAGSVTRRRMAHRVDAFSARVENGETVVTLGFNCACVGRATSNGGKLLMIEVREDADGARRAAEASETRRAEAAGAITTNDVKKTQADAETAGAGSASTAPLPEGPLIHRANEVDRVRELLLQQLRRAADQGIIHFKDGERPDAEAPAETQDDALPMDEAVAAHAQSLADEAPVDDAHADDAHVDGAPVDDAHADDVPVDEVHAGPAPDVPAAAEDDDAHARSEPAGEHEKKRAAERAVMPAKPAEKTRAETVEAHGAPAAKRRGSTSADEAHAETAEADAEAEVPPAPLAACLPDEAIDAGAWLDNRPFPEALAARRAALYDELNRVDPEAVADMAAFYLGHLFGAEAAHTIEIFGVESERLSLLAEAAAVVKGEPPALASPFARPEPCPGRHGLWQAAALWKTNPELSVAAFKATGRELARAPRAFRRLIGGRVARAALSLGDTELADEILQLLMRNQEPPTIDMLMARAELALQQGRVIAAQADLQKVIEARDPASPIAAIRLSRSLEPPRDAARAVTLSDTLSDFALQYRDTETGDALVTAEARLRARFNDLRGGLDVIHRAQTRLAEPAPAFDALARRLIERQIERLERDPRADTAIDAYDALSATGADPEADMLRQRLARVLIDTGTPHLATLLIDDAAAARSPESAALRKEALEASRLALQEMTVGARGGMAGRAEGGVDPMAHDPAFFDQGGGFAEAAHGEGDHGEPGAGMAHEGDEPGAHDRDAELKDLALKRYLAGELDLPPDVDAALENAADQETRALRRLFEPPLEPRARETGVEKITRGKQLLDDLDSDIDLLKGIANDG